MDESKVEEVRAIISRVARIDPKLITENASLRKDLWLDSLQAIQIVAVLEETFHVEIDEVEILNVDSLAEIVALVEEYLANGTVTS